MVQSRLAGVRLLVLRLEKQVSNQGIQVTEKMEKAKKSVLP